MLSLVTQSRSIGHIFQRSKVSNSKRVYTEKKKISLGISDEDARKWEEVKKKEKPDFKIKKRIPRAFKSMKQSGLVFSYEKKYVKWYNRLNTCLSLAAVLFY